MTVHKFHYEYILNRVYHLQLTVVSNRGAADDRTPHRWYSL